MKYLYYIPTTIYGMNHDPNDMHFIHDLIRKIRYAKTHDTDSVTLWGDGFQRRDVLYINDACRIIVENLHRENEVINLSPGKSYTIREYAKFICDILNYDFSLIKFDTDAFSGVKERMLENTLSLQHTSIENGLRETIYGM